MVLQQIIRSEQKSVAFVMYSLITRIMCWKTIAKFHDFFV